MNSHAPAGEPLPFRPYPKVRPPQPEAYLANRAGDGIANKLTRKPENWMNVRVLKTATRHAEELVELGAGSRSLYTFLRTVGADKERCTRFLESRQRDMQLFCSCLAAEVSWNCEADHGADNRNHKSRPSSIHFPGKEKPDMNVADLSVIVPAFNEAAVLPSLIERLRGVMAEIEVSYEILIVNDGSTDGTETYLDTLSRNDHRIKPINLARNFGKEAAMAAGMASAAAKCMVFIDADLQHPPDLIPRMYSAWRQGSDVVNAVKRQRSSELFLYRWFANRFNGMMSRMIGSNMAGASDYKLIDRQVAEVLLECPERNRFFRGLVAWVGFRVEDVEFDVVERETGSSKWSLASLIRYSLSNIIAFSSLPLVAVAYVGFVTAALGLLLLVQSLIRWVMGTAAVGFTTVIAVQVLLGGMILTALGVIAIYLSRMYDEQKSRPLFVIRRSRESGATSEDPASDIKRY